MTTASCTTRRWPTSGRADSISTRGFETSGLAYLRNARAGYALGAPTARCASSTSSIRNWPPTSRRSAAATTGPAVGQLDVATLIKASQAVFGEIDLPRLIETLMTITLQNAGADRGLLLLPRDGSFVIEAEARADGAGVEVRLRRAAMTAEDGPEAVINLVIRTRESALLEDGSRPGPVWESAFGARAPPRSAFCLPLLRQGRLAGVLYLENSQAAYAFTAQRMAVLEVLAAQAAIALENARLYGDLQAREAKIRRLVDSNIIGIFFWTLDGRVIEANDAFLALTGYDREDLRSGRIPLDRHDAARMAGRRSPGDRSDPGGGLRAALREGIRAQGRQPRPGAGGPRRVQRNAGGGGRLRPRPDGAERGGTASEADGGRAEPPGEEHPGHGHVHFGPEPAHGDLARRLPRGVPAAAAGAVEHPQPAEPDLLDRREPARSRGTGAGALCRRR